MMKNIISEKETSDANEYIQKLPAKGRGEGRNATSDVNEYIQELKEKRKRRRKKCVA